MTASTIAAMMTNLLTFIPLLYTAAVQDRVELFCGRVDIQDLECVCSRIKAPHRPCVMPLELVLSRTTTKLVGNRPNASMACKPFERVRHDQAGVLPCRSAFRTDLCLRAPAFLGHPTIAGTLPICVSFTFHPFQYAQPNEP